MPMPITKAWVAVRRSRGFVIGMSTTVFGISISRRRFQFALRLFAVAAVVAAGLSFGLIFSSRPIAAGGPKQTFSPSAVVNDAVSGQSSQAAADPILSEEMFRRSLLMDGSLHTHGCQLETCAMGTLSLPKVDLNKPKQPSVSSSTSDHILSAIPGAIKVGSLICQSNEISPQLNCLLKLTNKKSASRYVAAVRQTADSRVEVSQKISITWDVFSRSTLFAESQLIGVYAGDMSKPADHRRRGLLVGGEHGAFKLLPRPTQAIATTVANLQLATK
jgi:hypothetical protein